MMDPTGAERAALDLSYALLANVSENLRAASVSCRPGGFTLHFVFRVEEPEDRSDVDDIVAEFAALQPTNVRIDLDILCHDEVVDFWQIPSRLVYLKKDPRFY